jgi:hypothetical protein
MKTKTSEKDVISSLLQEAATKYSRSQYTTNAGMILRAVASIIPTSLIIQLFAHKLSK